MPARGPGRMSMKGLAWLARVGPMTGESWGWAMGWKVKTTESHTRRLVASGLLERTARFRGDGGSLLWATRTGTQMSRVDAVPLRRAPAPVTWAHHVACGEMAAYLTCRGREMRAPRELLVDERWSGELEWVEHGELRTRRHRPDFVARVDDGRVMAIEIELTAKSAARLRSVLGMYAGWLASGRLGSLLYVVDDERARGRLVRAGGAVGLERGDRFGVQLRSELQARLEEVRPAAVLHEQYVAL